MEIFEIMKYDYDIICIGLGPAGMAVSVMGTEMGLSICSIEKNKIGGECMNVGCIPSKSLLRMAKTRHMFSKLNKMQLDHVQAPAVLDPFTAIGDYIKYINDKKTVKMFDRQNVILGKGDASFVDAHTIEVNEKKISAKRIFIATGTSAMVPPIPGIDKVDILTNDNIFLLEQIPKSMIIIGGGAIGCEMAQAFSRLGCKCSIIQMDAYLVPVGDRDAGKLLEEEFKNEGIDVYNSKKIENVSQTQNGEVTLKADGDLEIKAEKLLVAAGRKFDFSVLNLEKAGIKYENRRGIPVNNYLQTNKSNIYAVGDCNGRFMLSHSAMHQGMIALMNTMLKWPFKKKFTNFVVPWTVFTEPQLSHVGMTEPQLQEKGIRYEVITANYADYGAAIAENVTSGFVKVFTSALGKIYGVSIVGESSGEMINEWALAIQKGVKMYDIMMLQHSFPTMGFLTKRTAEMWMMNKMKSNFIKKACQQMFRI